ncbi:hypothetical protein [Naasia sp. SYSU D00057]|uniref:hypothetical protein n=1 Tax=Naasia sp. SYSU D00057 TaxID=2817380 RepID=UPI0027DB14A3|nr:hypothetical protein [Naasia sp. SYSU D00057]
MTVDSERADSTFAADGDGGSETVLGLIAAPGKPAQLVAALRDELRAALEARVPGVAWRIEVVEDSLVDPQASGTELVGRAREELLDRDWDIAVCLTDLPLRIARRPVLAHASPVHGVGVISVPALGAVAVHRKAQDRVLRLVDALLGESEEVGSSAGPGRQRRMAQRARDLARDTEDGDASGLVLTSRVLTGDLRLLAGMVRANRPWRLAARLSRALTGAVATGVLALVTSDIWRLGASLDGARLTLVALAAVGAISATLIVGAGLWERARHRGVRHQVVLFNLATTITVAIGVLTLYAALLVLALLAAFLLVTPEVLGDVLERPVGTGDYVRLAWLAASLATLGGALGAGLESDEAVHEAAYTHRAGDRSGSGPDVADD